MLPLVSSDKALAALRRLECYTPRNANGSHLAVCRDVGGHRLTNVLVLGKHEVKRTTLKSLLVALHITEEEFIAALR